MICCPMLLTFFFFNDTATTEIYTLSLHDALPIYCGATWRAVRMDHATRAAAPRRRARATHHQVQDRKSTRLNSSHSQISYAVFCLKKKHNSPARRPLPDDHHLLQHANSSGSTQAR